MEAGADGCMFIKPGATFSGNIYDPRSVRKTVKRERR